jgi:hypothetical protein
MEFLAYFPRKTDGGWALRARVSIVFVVIIVMIINSNFLLRANEKESVDRRGPRRGVQSTDRRYPMENKGKLKKKGQSDFVKQAR